MYVNIFKQTPAQILVALINAENNLALTTDNVDIKIRENSSFGADEKVYSLVTGKKPYVGTREVSYTRLNLAKLFLGIQRHIPVPDGATKVRDLLPAIYNEFGLDIPESEIANLDDALPDWETESMASITLKTRNEKNDSSVVYSGEVAFNFVNSHYDLGIIITVTDLDGLEYPDDTQGIIGSASVMSYGRDYTPMAAFFSSDSSVKAGDLVNGKDSDKLGWNQLMMSVFDENWGVGNKADDPESAHDYYSGGASYLYNGTTADCPAEYPVDKDYKNVCLIQLGDDAGVKGILFQHYNDPA